MEWHYFFVEKVGFFYYYYLGFLEASVDF